MFHDQVTSYLLRNSNMLDERVIKPECAIEEERAIDLVLCQTAWANQLFGIVTKHESEPPQQIVTKWGSEPTLLMVTWLCSEPTNVTVTVHRNEPSSRDSNTMVEWTTRLDSNNVR